MGNMKRENINIKIMRLMCSYFSQSWNCVQSSYSYFSITRKEREKGERERREIEREGEREREIEKDRKRKNEVGVYKALMRLNLLRVLFANPRT